MSNTIFRRPKGKENPYVMIVRDVFEDKELSYKAKGLMGYLLSRPNDWIVRMKDLERRSTDGECAVRSTVVELEKCGYMTRTKTRSKNGRFIGYVVEVHEWPVPLNQRTGRENPLVDSPPVENPVLTDIDLVVKNEVTNPPSAELVKPPLKNTEKLCNPESNLEEKPLEGVTIEEPNETIPTEYAIIEDLNPYANTLFCPVCNHTQPWPRTKTARKKRPRLICGGCGAYFYITMEGNDFVYCWKLPEREWRVIIEGHDSYPCTEDQLADFKECWRADSKEFLSSLDWALKQSWMTKDKLIARAIAAWRTNMERKALKEHVKAMVPEPEPIEIDCPEWFE